MKRRTLLPLAALSAAALLLAGCGSADEPTVDVGAGPGTETPSAPVDDTPTDTPEATPVDDVPADETSDEPAAPETETSAPAAPATGDFLLHAEGPELALDRGDGTVDVIYRLDPAGESFFVSAAVRPGSTTSDLTAVLLASGEGMYDLRWVHFDGTDATVEYLPERFQLPGLLADGARPDPVWSPDGDSVAWVIADADGNVSLQTIGWSDGPGTQREAADSPDDPAHRPDDNASFGLEGLPQDVRAASWVAVDTSGSTIELRTTDGSQAWDADFERQGDGALALIEVTPAG